MPRSLDKAVLSLSAATKLLAGRPGSPWEDALGLEPGEAYGEDENVATDLGSVRAGRFTGKLSMNEQSSTITLWVKGIGDVAHFDYEKGPGLQAKAKAVLQAIQDVDHVSIETTRDGKYKVSWPSGLPAEVINNINGFSGKGFRNADEAQDAAQRLFPNATVDISASSMIRSSTRLRAGLMNSEEKQLFEYLAKLAKWSRDHHDENTDSAYDDHMKEIAGELADALVDEQNYFQIGDYGDGYVPLDSSPATRSFTALCERMTDAGYEDKLKKLVKDAIKYNTDVKSPKEVDKDRDLVVYHYQESQDGAEEQGDTDEMADLVAALPDIDAARRVAEELDRKLDGVGWDAPGDEKDLDSLVDKVKRGWGAFIRVPIYGPGWDFTIDIDSLEEEVNDVLGEEDEEDEEDEE